MELYTGTQADNARFAFEVMLTLVIGLMLLVQLGQILYATCRPKGLTLYFKSAANWVELVSNVLLLAAMGVWWTFVRNHAAKFSMALRYAGCKCTCVGCRHLSYCGIRCSLFWAKFIWHLLVLGLMPSGSLHHFIDLNIGVVVHSVPSLNFVLR